VGDEPMTAMKNTTRRRYKKRELEAGATWLYIGEGGGGRLVFIRV
jgi:hypothetical protein